jgi:histidine phosphotransferase ChpT
MIVTVELRALELLAARLCHELVSPVGAINNGVELLGEEGAEFVRDAIALIGQSARKAGQRLQFYRFAYGSTLQADSAQAESGRELSLGLFEGTKVRCEWRDGADMLAVDWQRLACNMLVLAAEALPRGGNASVRPLRADALGVEVVAEGEGVNVGPELRAALAEAARADQLTSRTIQAYFTARLAASQGAALALVEAGPQRALWRATTISGEPARRA